MSAGRVWICDETRNLAPPIIHVRRFLQSALNAAVSLDLNWKAASEPYIRSSAGVSNSTEGERLAF